MTIKIVNNLCLATLALLAPSVWGAWQLDRGFPLMDALAPGTSGSEGYTWNLVWDADGVAYLGRDRLWRWDGSTLKALPTPNFYAIRGMAFDANERLWLGGYNEFGYYDLATGEYTSRRDLFAESGEGIGEIWEVHIEGSVIWVGTHNELYRIKGNTVDQWRFSSEHRVIFHFLDDAVYAHEAGEGLWRIVSKRKELVNSDTRLAIHSIISLERLSSGNLLAVSVNGFFELGPTGNGILKYAPDSEVIRKRISCALRIDDSTVLIGTIGDGLFAVGNYGDTKAFYGANSELGTRMVFCIKKDPLGRVWLSDDSGIRLLDFNLPAGLIDSNLGLPDGRVIDLEYENGRLGIAQDKGVFEVDFRHPGKPTITRLSSFECFGISRHKSVFLFPNYDILQASIGGEALELKKFNKAITSFTVTEAGEVFLVFGEVLERYRLGGDWELEFIERTELGFDVQRLEVDGQGRIWGWSPRSPLLEIILQGPGMRFIHHRVIGERDLGVEDTMIDITEEGPLVMFDNALGRYLPEEGQWVTSPLPGMEGLKELPRARTFRSLGGDLEGWAIYWDEGLRSNRMIEFTWSREGSLVSRWLPWVDLSELGKVYSMTITGVDNHFFIIGGMRGLIVADRRLSEYIPKPGRPVIWDESGLNLMDSDRELAFGETSIQFNFSSAQGGGYYPVRYETRLNGLETEWSQSRTLGLREYGQVREGDYRFEVRAIDPFGRTSEVRSIGLVIHPPWYRRSVAYMGYLLAGFLILYGVIRLRERSLRVRQAELEAMVEVRTAELEKANAVKDDFIANLSHEIRNPLNGVIGLIRQLRPEKPTPERYLHSLRGAASYLQTTVEDVLDFAKLQRGRIQVEKETFDLAQMVTGVLGIYQDKAQEKGLGLTQHVRIPEGWLTVTDKRKVQQILGNLTGNAVKFTKEGSVHVGVLIEPGDEENAVLKIWVQDTGPGITEADRDRIFEKFVQTGESKAQQAGTGLGLPLVKGYVEVLGGELRLTTSLGAGSTFHVTLPVSLERVPEGAMEANEELVQFAAHVLVVEDLEYNRIFIESLLRELGCTVHSVEDGTKGYEEACNGSYDVIFLDWDLPGMTGLEIARRLRSNDGVRQEAFIIGLTAFATPEVRRECLESGMDAFLTKPIQPNQLVELLRSAVEIRSKEVAHLETGEADGSVRPPFPGLSRAADGPLVRGPGILAEMAKNSDWQTQRSRWQEFFEGYHGELVAAIATSDAQVIRKAAHRLLGHLRMLQIDVLPELLQDLLTAAQAGDVHGAKVEYAAFEEKLEQFQRELSTLEG
jgi:signal transduction histidine kinase/AmiR/NasT family two-component response regulator